MAPTESQNRRHPMRLPAWDYSIPGWYFVTMCVKQKLCRLGNILNESVELNECGQIARDTWLWLPQHYPFVELDEFVIMPNHIHGIVILNEPRRGGSRTAPTHGYTKSLGRLVGAFKTVSTKNINRLNATPGTSFWQRDFYDHIIRNDADLFRIRTYILNNPLQWSLDEENPEGSFS